VSERPPDYDTPWKEILDAYFEAFMAFFFPTANGQIDWTRGYEFLDKELQQVAPSADLGRRLVDKLAKVWRRNGEETWVLAHVEIQGDPESAFAERMYVYNYRLFDRYHLHAAGFAVLCDDRPSWRPDEFGYEALGTEVLFRFSVAKLLGYQERWDELEENDNPFATVTMAHLKAIETRHDPISRKSWKFRLTRRLYERGYGRADVINLLLFIDWAMALPQELEAAFRDELHQYEEERAMPYVTSFERFGIEKGALLAAREDLLDVLSIRFEQVPPSTAKTIEEIDDRDSLRWLHREAVKTPSMEDFIQSLQAYVQT